MDRLTGFFTELMRKYLPDPFVFAIILTLLTLVMAIIFGNNPIDMNYAWGQGFWSLLAFGMQMTVILAAGAVLATTPIVERGLDWLVTKVHSPRMAIIVATLVGGIGSYLNWGFGLIIGGIIAKKLALNVKGVHHPLIIASAYSGFTLYGLGLSATIPITISAAGHPLEDRMGIIPLAETIFSPWMLGCALAILITLPLINASMHPKDPAKIVEINRELHAPAEVPTKVVTEDMTIGTRLNNSKILGITMALFGLLYAVVYFTRDGKMDINIINLIILFIGMLVLQTPAAYVKKLQQNISLVSGIVLQFPFYAGIMALLDASGLVEAISNAFVAISTPATLGFWGLISSFLINFFAPSAGGHWVIQGPFMADAAVQLNSSMAQMAMSVQLGNAWNDLVQPFWILPALALSKLKLKDIMGYTVVSMLAMGVIYIAATLAWGFFS
ncbi:MAG: short-chain fatty acid transporter [Brooklawnia sp.]|jgi:short-chain fatty acids transporter